MINQKIFAVSVSFVLLCIIVLGLASCTPTVSGTGTPRIIDSNPTTQGEAAPEAIKESTLENEIESPASEPEDSPGKPLSITVQIDSNHAEQALIPMEGRK